MACPWTPPREVPLLVIALSFHEKIPTFSQNLTGSTDCKGLKPSSFGLQLFQFSFIKRYALFCAIPKTRKSKNVKVISHVLYLKAQVPWVVTPSEKVNSDAMFATVDTDHDGLVSGAEIRGIMVQSGLANNVLAHIW